VLGVIKGGLSVPDHPGRTRPAGDSGWRFPSPDSAGRMVLDNLVTYAPLATDVPKYWESDALERVVRARGVWGTAAAQAFQQREHMVRLRLATFLDQFRNRLVWLIEYANEPMYLGGAPWLSTRDRPAPVDSGVCELVIVMDASVDSGTYRYDDMYNILAQLQVCWRKGSVLVGGHGGTA
jgi:hypothetical protein